MKNKLNTKITLIVILTSLLIYILTFVLILSNYSGLPKDDNDLILPAFIGLVIIMLIALFVLLYIFNAFLKPVLDVVNILKILEKGKIEDIPKLKIKSDDELGEMSKSTNNLVSGLNSLADFASEVGKGNYSAEYNQLSKDDKLGSLLLEMRDSLAKSKKENEKNKHSAEKRNWINTGLAVFGELLRADSSDIDKFTYKIISELVKYLGANQGAILLINDDDKSNIFLQLMGAYAFEKAKISKKRIEIGESLTGQCVLEKEVIYLTDLPEGYTTITSGLGKATPRNVIIVPLLFNEEVQGVIEIASFAIFDKYEKSFIEKVAEAIATTFATLKINNNTAKLLEDAKFQREQMLAQEEEMKQNMEQIKAHQDETELQIAEYEKTIEDLKKQIG